MNMILKLVLKIVVVLVVIGIIALIYVFSGAYNVAATVPHTSITREFLEIMVDNSVERHAKSITVPENFTSIDYKEGFPAYDAMCIDCHGAPGVERSEFGKGLYPRGPSLYRHHDEGKDKGEGDDDDDASEPQQLFWIVKNGIKMTGMPAFESTHSDEQMWKIVAFVQKLPDITPEEYQMLRDSTVSDHHEEMEQEH